MKVKIRFINILAITLFFMLLFPISVKATTITAEDLENILDVIPSEITLGITELEYKKAETMLSQEIEKIWKEKNIDTTQIDVSYNAPIYVNEEDLYRAEISIQDKENGTLNNSKIIDIKYKNTDNKNQIDEQYVKKLDIKEIKYYEVPLNDLTNDVENCLNLVEKQYNNLVNDENIQITLNAGAGEINGLNVSMTLNINIFKNKVYYNSIVGKEVYSVPVINVPSTISDNEINNYVISQITKYNKEFGENITNIEKGNKLKYGEDIDVENGYTIFVKNLADIEGNYIIIRKEKTEIVEEDTTTGIKLETDTKIVPENTVLETKKVTESKTIQIVEESIKDVSTKFVTYDITLKSEGVAIQPNGKVKIQIPIPNGYDKTKLLVYRISEDGTKTKYDIKIEENYVIIETDHFSTYVLAENNVTEKEEKTNNNTSSDNKLDETPKTGTTVVKEGILFISLISLVGIVILKKNKR